MSKAPKQKTVVPLEEVVLAQSFELEALLNVLKRGGVHCQGRGVRKNQTTPRTDSEGEVTVGLGWAGRKGFGRSDRPWSPYWGIHRG